MKDEFLATLSHEIRTPLNAVLGWTQILLGAPGRSRDARPARSRSSSATPWRRLRLVDDMLDMARIMSGKLRLELQPVDLAAIALAAIDVVAPAAAARGDRAQDESRRRRAVDERRRRPRCSRSSGTCCRTR